MKKETSLFGLIWRFLILVVLYTILFVAGAGILQGHLPDITPEPGVLTGITGLLLIAVVNTLLIMILIIVSRWQGWRLAALLSLAWYGANTFIMQIETWYFLSDLTVDDQLMPLLFLMGMPVAFVFIPLAVWVLKGMKSTVSSPYPYDLKMPLSQWVGKLAIIAVAYVLLYWLAGYFIAWQNPELRAFYGSPGTITPFWQHTAHTLKTDPWLFPFQVLRAMIWTLCMVPILYGSSLKVWPAAILVGVFISIPQNIGHILENPLIPQASVRLSHLVETASSTFLFGMVVVWLLHRRHYSLRDLFR